MMIESPRVARAIVSVSDKLGLAGFARGLVAAGVEIFSTGGTRKHLESEGIAVRDLSEYTGFPEMMDGRLKTLHPKVHGGILCRRDNPEDMRALAEHGISTFELVVVNLYPFEATVARKGVAWEQAIEQIDIGGPTLVRAAAKNHAFTTVATDAAQYSEILDQIAVYGCTTLELRRRLAAAAFAHTARYDRAIADFFAGQSAPTRRCRRR
jgi:phosphoribosylaminoimidazolecarboxamide formyltransferase/IMP cyclohydrolase